MCWVAPFYTTPILNDQFSYCIFEAGAPLFSLFFGLLCEGIILFRLFLPKAEYTGIQQRGNLLLVFTTVNLWTMAKAALKL